MELIKVTKKGSIHFKLDDGRLGVSYNSGYIRVSVKGINNKLYQINKKIILRYGKLNDQYHYKRELITLSSDRINTLLEFNNNNCK
jgi:hypothetical protein|tara:strand:- start:362 stop:619 length:258 start_codon:yes stop_codon:yes gene_type:complete